MEITEARKLKAIRHIVNDYSNLVWCGTMMTDQKKYRDLERSFFSFDFLLFYRSLAGFLSNKRFKERHRKGDIDISAKDFLNRKSRFPLPEWGKWDNHMNAHLFHLGYLRTRNSRPWTGDRLETLFVDFKAQWKLFCDQLPEPYKSAVGLLVEERRKELGVPLYSGGA